MKNILKYTVCLAVMAIIIGACDKPENPQTEKKERVVVYTVEHNEKQQKLETEEAWNALLEQFCDHARAGREVTFYNLNQTACVRDSKDVWGTKAGKSFVTTNRNEMIAWMKEMETAGLTVRVTYNDADGTWRGTAYATAPSQLTTESIIGTWHLNCMVTCKIDKNGNLLDGNLYEPDEGGGSMYYTFCDDGSMSLTLNGVGGTSATETSVWTLDDDGVLVCTLLPHGGSWNVNWITSNTMIFSRSEFGTEDGDQYIQLQFDRQ